MHKFLILCKKSTKTLGGFNGNHYLCSEKVAKLLTQHCTNKVLNSKFDSMQSIESSNKGEIVMYQPDETIRLEVRVEDETVWLTQAQLVSLFHSSKGNISEHISNIYEQGELKQQETVRKFRTVQKEGNRMVNRTLTYYNLDVIISVGFRVNTSKGIEFRQWANGVLKEYLLRGYALNQKILDFEQRVERHIEAQNLKIGKLENDVASFVRSSLPPVEGIFYDGQIFDAYVQIVNLIKQAQRKKLFAYIKMQETSANDLLSRIR